MALKMIGEPLSANEVAQQILRDSVYYQNSGGGVTISGGEPLSQPEFTLSILKSCKKEGIHTAVDTSGFCRWQLLSKLIPYVDIFLYDVKVINSNKHFDLVGVSNSPILGNLEKLSRQEGKKVIVRVPIIPGYTDSDENVFGIAEFIKSLGLEKISLLSFNKMSGSKYKAIGKHYNLDNTVPLTRKKMEGLRMKITRLFGLEVW